MVKIVGLCGLMHSGKSEVAKHLANNHCWERRPFAGGLKAMLKAIGLTDEHLYGKLKDVPCEMLGGKAPRWAMQSLGTEWGRQMIHPDLWVLIWKAGLPNGPCPGVVAEDVRFANERLEIKRLGGIIVQVHRPGLEVEGEHASEANDIVSDHIIINDKGIADLQRRVDWLLKLGG